MVGARIQSPIRRHDRATLALLAALVGVFGSAGAWADFATGLAAFRAGDYGLALSQFQPLAAQGDAQAQFHLGVSYQKGWGVIADATKAAQWYRRAADQGLSKAQHNLALLYLRGEGVQADAGQARAWFERAAQQGDLRAAHELGLMYFRGVGVERDFAQARSWWEKAAAGGEASAAYDLGILYRRGQGGVPRDVAASIKLWNRAAHAGLAVAQNALGACYMNGDGVDADMREAWAWFRLAVDGGLKVASVNADMARSQLDDGQFIEARRRFEALHAELAANPPP